MKFITGSYLREKRKPVGRRSLELSNYRTLFSSRFLFSRGDSLSLFFPFFSFFFFFFHSLFLVRPFARQSVERTRPTHVFSRKLKSGTTRFTRNRRAYTMVHGFYEPFVGIDDGSSLVRVKLAARKRQF